MTAAGFDVGRFVPDPEWEEAQRQETALISEGFCPRDRVGLDIGPTLIGELAGWCPVCGNGWSASSVDPNDSAGGPFTWWWFAGARPGR